MKTVYIVRGASGCGKGDFADTLSNALPNSKKVSAEAYFDYNGHYCYDREDVQDAHSYCQRVYYKALDNPDVENIIVCNTNANNWEVEIFTKPAIEKGYKIVSMVMENRKDTTNAKAPMKRRKQQAHLLRNSLKLL